jgi:hypothetical protein
LDESEAYKTKTDARELLARIFDGAARINKRENQLGEQRAIFAHELQVH